MYTKNLNFKPVFFKVLLTYLLVYFLSLVFRYLFDIEPLLNHIQYKYLIALNIICIFLGLPLTTIFDFILIKLFGINYVFLFSPILTIVSVIQVLILRKINSKFYKSFLFLEKPEKNYFYKNFENINFRPYYILILRSFPIIPHILGSYIIASSKFKKNIIIINTFLGSIFYYVLLFFIISNVS